MTTDPAQVERRVGQRFPFLLPVSFRVTTTDIEGVGFTQDVSSRGVFFLTAASLHEGDAIELTLTMPAEITLGESMRVRCRGHVIRMIKSAGRSLPNVPNEVVGEIPPPGSVATPAGEAKVGVAVRLEGYEYLPDTTAVTASPRVAVLHPHREEDQVTLTPSQR